MLCITAVMKRICFPSRHSLHGAINEDDWLLAELTHWGCLPTSIVNQDILRKDWKCVEELFTGIIERYGQCCQNLWSHGKCQSGSQSYGWDVILEWCEQSQRHGIIRNPDRYECLNWGRTCSGLDNIDWSWIVIPYLHTVISCANPWVTGMRANLNQLLTYCNRIESFSHGSMSSRFQSCYIPRSLYVIFNMGNT